MNKKDEDIIKSVRAVLANKFSNIINDINKSIPKVFFQEMNYGWSLADLQTKSDNTVPITLSRIVANSINETLSAAHQNGLFKQYEYAKSPGFDYVVSGVGIELKTTTSNGSIFSGASYARKVEPHILFSYEYERNKRIRQNGKYITEIYLFCGCIPNSFYYDGPDNKDEKSTSAWTTLVIPNEHAKIISNGTVFGSFQCKQKNIKFIRESIDF